MYMDPQTYELSGERKRGHFFVDDTIAPTIQTLNQKGFITSACCSGHNEYTPEYAYIQYDFGEITPKYLPEDWYWCDNGQQMEFQYQSEAGEERPDLPNVLGMVFVNE